MPALVKRAISYCRAIASCVVEAIQTRIKPLVRRRSAKGKDNAQQPVTILPQIGGNQPCPCRSTRKYEDCCGYPFGGALAERSIPEENILAIGRSFDPGRGCVNAPRLANLLYRGNISLAESLLATAQEGIIPSDEKHNMLGWIASHVRAYDFAVHHFQEAVRLSAGQWGLPLINLKSVERHLQPPGLAGARSQAQLSRPRAQYLVIKAWGYGFWSDVFHVLGQLLLAEITDRTPVIHWGSNSLFSDGNLSDGFNNFFAEPASETIEDLIALDLDVWPPKWQGPNLGMAEINRFEGRYSRVGFLHFLRRPESVLVNDFYAGVVDIASWIPRDHRLAGMRIDELYRYLIRRYLKPADAIEKEVQSFYEKHLKEHPYAAVHMRGSDKITETRYLEDLHAKYHPLIEDYLNKDRRRRILLLTDDARILHRLIDLYGDRLVCTPSARTDSDKGIHYQPSSSRRGLGVEVMVDTYLASKAEMFIGTGASNVSVAISYIGEWDEDHRILISHNLLHHRNHNMALHDW